MKKLILINVILAILLIASIIDLIDARQLKHVDNLSTCDRFKYAYSITVEQADYKQALDDCKIDSACMDVESFFPRRF